MITIKDLVGEWELSNFIIEKQNGVRKPWGKNMTGLLIYTSNGYMSVSINQAIDKRISSAEDKFKSILFYSGTYEVVEDKIIHHVTNASDLNRIDNDMVREATLDLDKLMLIGHGDFGSAFLTWRKISYSYDYNT